MRMKIVAVLAAAAFGVAGPGMHLTGGARSGSLLIASALSHAL